jgi:hypothetical protein
VSGARSACALRSCGPFSCFRALLDRRVQGGRNRTVLPAGTSSLACERKAYLYDVTPNHSYSRCAGCRRRWPSCPSQASAGRRPGAGESPVSCERVPSACESGSADVPSALVSGACLRGLGTSSGLPGALGLGSARQSTLTRSWRLSQLRSIASRPDRCAEYQFGDTHTHPSGCRHSPSRDQAIPILAKASAKRFAKIKDVNVAK